MQSTPSQLTYQQNQPQSQSQYQYQYHSQSQSQPQSQAQAQTKFQPQTPQYINPIFFEQFQPYINPYSSGNGFSGYQQLGSQSAQTFDAMQLFNQAQTIQSYFSLNNILTQLQGSVSSGQGQNQGSNSQFNSH